MFNQILSLFRSKVEEAPALPATPETILKHIAMVTPDSRFGVIRVTTSLDPSSSSYAGSLQGMAQMVTRETGWPARAVPQLNEIHLVSLAADAVAPLAKQLREIAVKFSGPTEHVLTERQHQLLSRIDTSAATSASRTVAGENYLVIKIPFAGATDGEGAEVSALVRNLLRVENPSQINSYWDGATGQVCVNLPASHDDTGKELLQILGRLSGGTVPVLSGNNLPMAAQ